MNRYIGVTCAGDRFKVQIARKNKVYYLGVFDDQDVAAKYADLSSLISAPWFSRGKPPLNFEDSRAQPETYWSELQKAMIEDLRRRHPECESNFKKRTREELYIPDVLFEDMRNYETHVDTMRDKSKFLIDRMKSCLTQLSKKLGEEEVLTAFYRDKCTGMEDELAMYKRMRDATLAPKPKFTMKVIADDSDPNFVRPAPTPEAQPATVQERWQPVVTSLKTPVEETQADEEEAPAPAE